MELYQNSLPVIIGALHVLHLSTFYDFNICILSSLIEVRAQEYCAHECNALLGETQPTFCDGSEALLLGF